MSIFIRSAACAVVLAALVTLSAAAGSEDHCNGCSCKCGPGFRLPNRHCASWGQHWFYMAKGGYPAGTVDELETAEKNPNCPPDEILKKRKQAPQPLR